MRDVKAEIRALKAERARLRLALYEYADRKNWEKSNPEKLVFKLWKKDQSGWVTAARALIGYQEEA